MGGGCVDCVVLGVAAVDEQLGGRLASAGHDLGEHRGALAQVAAAVGGVDADDDASVTNKVGCAAGSALRAPRMAVALLAPSVIRRERAGTSSGLPAPTEAANRAEDP